MTHDQEAFFAKHPDASVEALELAQQAWAAAIASCRVPPLTDEQIHRVLEIVDSRKFSESRAVDAARRAYAEGIVVGFDAGAKQAA